MDDKTLEALRGSIAKWEAIVAGTGSDAGPSNCPLCKVFWRTRPGGGLADDSCVGCPVMEETGQPGCGGTPYDAYEAGEATAEDELEFLRSLLPEQKSQALAEEA